jgi:diacylglycerol kinase (ATP)
MSVDFAALVNQRANLWKWPKGPSRYKFAMVAELAAFKPVRYTAIIDGVEKQFEAMLCSVGNSPYFGGGMLVAPHAKIDDGKLELFIVNKISRLELLKVFPRVYTGDHVTHPAVEFISAKKVTLSSKIQMPAFSDGEPVGFAPVTAEIVPGALRVYATSARQSSVA